MTMTAELPRIPDALAQSPASDKVVWNYLYDAAKPLTKPELQARTKIHPRTLDAALGRLREDGFVTTAPAEDGSSCYRAYTLSEKR
jgi:DNA-binding HxlR family transcriptional regulator